MKATSAVVLCLALGMTGAGASDASPIGKVVQLLSDLQAKVVKEGAEAQKVYEQFAEFCEDRSKQLGFDIKTSNAQIEELKASIAQDDSSIGSLMAKVEELSGSIAGDEADLKAATSIRGKEAADFAAEEKELMEIIDMLNRAIGILEKEMAKGSASMLQLKDASSVTQALQLLVQASALSSSDGVKLTALVQAAQQSDDSLTDSSLGAPAAAVYEGHSGEIISTLESLLEKAEAQLAEARKKETTAKHSFEMMKQSLEDSIKFATKDMGEAKKGLGKSGESKASAEGELKVTTEDLNVDTTSLADLHQDCMTKAQDHEAAVKSRSEEIATIAKAKEAITENTDGADKVVYGLNQVSFLQFGRSQLSSSADLVRFEAAHFLRDLARKQNSPALAQLAARVAGALRSSGGEDVFAKVKGLISEMIEHLEAEADAEASHKAYCDKEIAEASAKKADKDSEIEKLSVKIEQMTSRSAKLKEEVADLQKSLSELIAAQADMDKLRAAEHEDFTTTKADLEQGLEGVKLALKVLRSYYSNASGAAHTASKGAGDSIIGLLEVIESDLTKSLAETEATEESAATTYDSESKENAIEKTSKEQDVKYKTKEAAGLDKAVAETTADRAGVQNELDAVMKTLKVLAGQCTAKVETYAERKARREAELAGLKEALNILEGQAVLLQQHSQRTLRLRRLQ